MTANDSSKAPPGSIDGTWRVTIHGPTGPQETSLELNSNGGVLEGVQSAMGQVEKVFEISYDAKNGEIVWINKIKKPLPIKLEFRGVVDGTLMSGKVKAGIMGSFPFTATKN